MIRTAWVIGYTARRGDPMIFEDTVRRRRKDAWAAWSKDLPETVAKRLRNVHRAKAFKCHVELIA